MAELHHQTSKETFPPMGMALSSMGTALSSVGMALSSMGMALSSMGRDCGTETGSRKKLEATMRRTA